MHIYYAEIFDMIVVTKRDRSVSLTLYIINA